MCLNLAQGFVACPVGVSYSRPKMVRSGPGPKVDPVVLQGQRSLISGAIVFSGKLFLSASLSLLGNFINIVVLAGRVHVQTLRIIAEGWMERLEQSTQ